jgi:mono/diheme cytochrome c family protein
VLNRGSAIVRSAGIWPRRLATLEVPGRRTGRVISFPVVIADHEGERYLVAMFGEGTNWVRNVRAAEGRAVVMAVARSCASRRSIRQRGRRSCAATSPARRELGPTSRLIAMRPWKSSSRSHRRSPSFASRPSRQQAVLRAEIVTRRLMLASALAAALGLLAAACGGGGHRGRETTSSTSTTLAAQQQGGQIFQARCASCHDARLAAQVTRDFPNIDDEIAVVTNGRASPLETMPSFGDVLTSAQIRDAVEYTRVQLGK